MERLHKVMARAGVASRRRCEELIAAGRVTVNGEVVSTPGSQVDPTRDHIEVDGQPIHAVAEHSYVLLYKPAGYLATA
ncbi:MAG: rRNA pseudouridine synthase, partial [Chloroflexi bacterium]|nr:rRNA pseudouridine synthase [Chloroflexota bacterium]